MSFRSILDESVSAAVGYSASSGGALLNINQPSTINVSAATNSVNISHVAFYKPVVVEAHAAMVTISNCMFNGTGPDLNPADIFLISLKAIEESSPEDSYRYDDISMEIQDLRGFDKGNLSMLGVVSFCMANMADPEPVIEGLEARGMVLV